MDQAYSQSATSQPLTPGLEFLDSEPSNRFAASALPLILTIALIAGLVWANSYNYLLFHAFAEGFSIIVACGMFIIAWNTRRFLENQFLLFLGIAYLFVGGLDLVHTLGFKGMAIFSGYDSNLATELWIAARYVESVSLLVAPHYLRRALRPYRVMFFYVGGHILLLWSIFSGFFPDCFVEGSGLTSFKIGSEYVIALILLGALVLLVRQREAFDRQIFWRMCASIGLTIASEMAFTLYTDPYGVSNFVGHVLKAGSFYLIYQALIRTALQRPYALLFRNLKQQEETLRNINETLEIRVQERTTELQQEIAARLRISEAANQAKNEFLANMSHELRTPLNGVLGYAQILKRDPQLTAKHQEQVNVIERSGQHLFMLINDMLDLAKIEAGRIETRQTVFRLPEFLQTLIDMLTMSAQQKGLQIRLELAPEVPTVVCGDEVRLRQILLNLLGNAVKFTDQGSVSLRVEVFDKLGAFDNSPTRRFRFSVADTGIGIAPEHVDTIFLPFEQMRDQNPLSSGTGLGLTISQRLAHILGTQIHVESVPGQGSTFWFEIALAEERDLKFAVPAQTVSPVIGFEGRPRTILLVDDEPDNLYLLRDIVEPLGFHVLEATDGQEALDMTIAEHPDLICMDLKLPELDGLEVTQRIRQRPELHDIVVISISANAFPEVQQQCLDAGCQAFLTKPVEAEALLEVLRHHLQVTWTYADDSGPETEVVADDPNANQVLPPLADLQTLSGLVERRMILDIRRWLDRIEQQDERYAAFTEEIRQLSRQFDFDRIHERLIQAMEEHYAS